MREVLVIGRFWNLLDAAAFYLAYLCSGLIARLILLIANCIITALDYSANHVIFDSERFFDQVIRATESSQIVILILSNLVALALVFLIIHLRGAQLKKYTALADTKVSNICGAVICGVLLNSIIASIMAILPQDILALKQYDTFVLEFLNDNLLLVVPAVILVAPVVEEFVFRGALYRALSRGLGTVAACVITSAVFAVAHADPVQMIYAFLLGLVLAITRARSGRLAPCIALHIAFNAANFIKTSVSEVPFFVLVALLVPAAWITLRSPRRTTAV